MIEQLTPRERTIVAELGQGKSVKGIAEALGLKESSVRQYMVVLRDKTGMTARQIGCAVARCELEP